MKSPYLFSCLGMALCFIFLTRACPPVSSQDEIRYTEDCYEDRKTQATITQQKGSIKKVGDQFHLVLTDDANTRYLPCNLDTPFQVEGKIIVFDGWVKETFPQERWAATPFVLRSIRNN